MDNHEQRAPGGFGYRIKEKAKDIAWNISGKGTAPSMSRGKRTLVIIGIVLLLVAASVFRVACSDEMGTAPRDWNSHLSDDYTMQYSADVLSVRNGTNAEIGGTITYGQAFDNFFSDGKWESFTSDNQEDVVEFNGVCIYADEDYGVETEIEACIQFLLYDDGTFELYYLDYNGEPQNNLTKLALLAKVFDTYAEDYGIATEASTTTTLAPTTTTATPFPLSMYKKYLGRWSYSSREAYVVFNLQFDGEDYYFSEYTAFYGVNPDTGASQVFADEYCPLYLDFINFDDPNGDGDDYGYVLTCEYTDEYGDTSQFYIMEGANAPEASASGAFSAYMEVCERME